MQIGILKKETRLQNFDFVGTKALFQLSSYHMIKEPNTVIYPIVQVIVFLWCCCRSICSHGLSGSNPRHSRFCPHIFGKLYSLFVLIFMSILDLSFLFCLHSGFKMIGIRPLAPVQNSVSLN